MDKGLCYFCDEAYERGHRCKFREPELFTVEVPEDNDTGYGDEEEGQPGVNLAETEPCISVNALDGNQNFQTMQIKYIIHGKASTYPGGFGEYT